jgi:ketosteroid isomerase-like protein
MGITTGNSADVVSLLSPDVIYTVSGHHPLAGTFHGPIEVDAHLRQLFSVTSGTFEVLKSIDWLVGLTNVAVIQFAQAEAGGRIYQGHHMFVLEADQHDLLTKLLLFFEDPNTVDRFLAQVPGN